MKWVAVSDEVKKAHTYSYITFVDWMEALCRVADMKSMPSDDDIAIMRTKKMIPEESLKSYLFATQQAKNQVSE